MAKYDKGNHAEIPDQTPVELPLGYSHPESLEEVIARMIRADDFRKQQQAAGMETFEEADDFDVDGEDEEFHSEHEMSVMQEEFVEQKRGPARERDLVGEENEVKKVERSEGVGRDEEEPEEVKQRVKKSERKAVAKT